MRTPVRLEASVMCTAVRRVGVLNDTYIQQHWHTTAYFPLLYSHDKLKEYNVEFNVLA